MDLARWSVGGAIALVLSVTLVSGPIVGAVDFTRAPTSESTRGADDFRPGTGSIELTVESTPSTVTVDEGRFGADVYYLEVPDATVRIHSIEGQPMLVYKLRLPELGYSRSTTQFLDESFRGHHTLSIEETTIPPDRFRKDRYAGELIVLTRIDNEDTVHYRGNVTVVVE